LVEDVLLKLAGRASASSRLVCNKIYGSGVSVVVGPLKAFKTDLTPYGDNEGYDLLVVADPFEIVGRAVEKKEEENEAVKDVEMKTEGEGMEEKEEEGKEEVDSVPSKKARIVGLRGSARHECTVEEWLQNHEIVVPNERVTGYDYMTCSRLKDNSGKDLSVVTVHVVEHKKIRTDALRNDIRKIMSLDWSEDFVPKERVQIVAVIFDDVTRDSPEHKEFENTVKSVEKDGSSVYVLFKRDLKWMYGALYSYLDYALCV
jgi:hypothetical protein